MNKNALKEQSGDVACTQSSSESLDTFGLGNFVNLNILAFKIIAICGHTFLPVQSHASDSIVKHFWISLLTQKTNSVLHFFNVPELDSSQLLFEMGENCEITGHEVRTVGVGWGE